MALNREIFGDDNASKDILSNAREFRKGIFQFKETHKKINTITDNHNYQLDLIQKDIVRLLDRQEGKEDPNSKPKAPLEESAREKELSVRVKMLEQALERQEKASGEVSKKLDQVLKLLSEKK